MGYVGVIMLLVTLPAGYGLVNPPAGFVPQGYIATVQSPGDQAACAVILGGGLIDAVHLERRFGLPGNIKRFPSGGLHSGRQLVTGDAGLQVGLTGIARQVPAVERLQQIEILPQN